MRACYRHRFISRGERVWLVATGRGRFLDSLYNLRSRTDCRHVHVACPTPSVKPRCDLEESSSGVIPTRWDRLHPNVRPLPQVFPSSYSGSGLRRECPPHRRSSGRDRIGCRHTRDACLRPMPVHLPTRAKGVLRGPSATQTPSACGERHRLLYELAGLGGLTPLRKCTRPAQSRISGRNLVCLCVA